MPGKSMAALAAVSLLGMNGMAAAQSAAPLSLAASPAASRVGAPTESAGDLRGRGAGIYIIGAVVIGLIVWGIIELTDDGDEAFPVSP